jgi:peptide-methionine (R)-S-oxide reductase
VANRQRGVGDVPVKRTDSEWRKRLSPEAYNVLVGRGTEPSFTSPLDKEKRAGVFRCAGCSQPLFKSQAKYNSGTGWPSFFEPASAEAVDETIQPLYMIGDLGAREARCSGCGGHLGHSFSDGPKPTRRRFCINGVALEFVPAEK